MLFKKIFFWLFFISVLSCKGQNIEKKYATLVERVFVKRDSLSKKFTIANAEKKEAIILEAREYLVNTMATKLFTFWYGTKWDFNGTTRIPQKGKIACGYFVTNILTDVGFRIPRIKWAQSASEIFIKKLAKNNLKRFSNVSITTVKNYLINAGNGIYLVGLDAHTGFIYVNNNEVKFIHADYYEPEKGVVSENIDSLSPINDSSYRVIGKLMSDEMILYWLNQEYIN